MEELADGKMQQSRTPGDQFALDQDENSDADYDIEEAGGSGDELDDGYYDEKEQELAQIHVKAMIEQVLKLTEQCGDINLAMTMMRLDSFEKSIVVQHLQEHFDFLKQSSNEPQTQKQGAAKKGKEDFDFDKVGIDHNSQDFLLPESVEADAMFAAQGDYEMEIGP
jgi:hypothetical protein